MSRSQTYQGNMGLEGATSVLAQAAMDSEAEQETHTATFAMGCFWGPDALFGVTPGVLRTRVGYAGGTLENPTYHHLGDHTETVQIDYDPSIISYQDLLQMFWQHHRPEIRGLPQQYRSFIFYHDETQRQQAQVSLEKEEARRNKDLYTEIRPFRRFYLAEDYHQKYWLQQDSVLREEFRERLPTRKELISSTVAARVNGYVAGRGGCGALRRDLPELDLSEQARNRLLELVCGAG